jgi:hypothetical protein
VAEIGARLVMISGLRYEVKSPLPPLKKRGVKIFSFSTKSNVAFAPLIKGGRGDSAKDSDEASQ